MRRMIWTLASFLLLAWSIQVNAGGRITEITRGQFVVESPKFGQFFIRDTYLVVENTTHPLMVQLSRFAKQSSGKTLSLAISTDGSEVSDADCLVLQGRLTITDGIVELLVTPQKGERFAPVHLALVTVDHSHLDTLKSFADKRVQLVLRPAS